MYVCLLVCTYVCMHAFMCLKWNICNKEAMLSYINFLLKRKYERGKKLQTFEKIQKNKK